MRRLGEDRSPTTFMSVSRNCPSSATPSVGGGGGEQSILNVRDPRAQFLALLAFGRNDRCVPVGQILVPAPLPIGDEIDDGIGG